MGRRAGGVGDSHADLTAFGWLPVCFRRAANDFRFDGINHPHGCAMDGKENALFVEVLHWGWPYVFIVTCEHLCSGEELLVDYGEQYWEGYASVLKQRRMMESVVKNVRSKILAPLEAVVS